MKSIILITLSLFAASNTFASDSDLMVQEALYKAKAKVESENKNTVKTASPYDKIKMAPKSNDGIKMAPKKSNEPACGNCSPSVTPL